LPTTKNSTANEARYILTTVATIPPQLSDNDTIHTIDSCRSHLVSISSQGHITTWAIEDDMIAINTMKTIKNTEPFFSFAINQQEKIIYLGLNNGSIFIADITNLVNNKIISILSSGRINWINSCADKVLFCALCECDLKLCLQTKENMEAKDCLCNCHRNNVSCTNEHTLLAASKITTALSSKNTTDLKGSCFLDIKDSCPKAIYLLPDNTAILHRKICFKNTHLYEKVENYKEDIALISTANVTLKPQALYITYLSSTFLSYCGGYPIHVITEDNNLSIVRENVHGGCFITRLETNTNYKKIKPIIVNKEDNSNIPNIKADIPQKRHTIIFTVKCALIRIAYIMLWLLKAFRLNNT
jgi:hypothetical protein